MGQVEQLDNPYDWRARITPDLKEQFARDGVVFLKQALHPDWLQLIELGLARVMTDGGQTKHKFYADRDDEFLETIRNFDVTPEIQRLVYDSPIADMIGALIGSENVWYYADEFFIKARGGCGRTPWHQDTSYWPIAGKQIASMWISLDPLPREECLEYVAGSHLGEMFDGFNPAEVSRDPTLPYYDEDLPPLPDIEADRSKWNIVSWDIEPGDVIMAHPSVLHGGGQTAPGSRRRAITVRCYGDDLCYAARPPSRPIAPRIPGLSLQLKPGEPLRSSMYPRLRPLPEHKRLY